MPFFRNTICFILVTSSTACSKTEQIVLSQPLKTAEYPVGNFNPKFGPSTDYQTYSVTPISFEASPKFDASAVLFKPNLKSNNQFAVIVLPGHFGEGKSAGECQDISHDLALNGIMALIVDMPGYEEHDTPHRQIHFDNGKHNRGVLFASGSSALFLQLHIIKQAIELLKQLENPSKIAVTGSSGGAVLSYYTLLQNPDLAGGVMSSFVPIPHELGSGGCFCDELIQPDFSPTGAIQPTLWISELEQPKPNWLPKNANFVISEGPHSYTKEHRSLAGNFFGKLFDKMYQSADVTPYTSPELLQSKPDPEGISIIELAQLLPTPEFWNPTPLPGLEYSVECIGEGKTILYCGGELPISGFRTCSFSTSIDEIEYHNILSTGVVPADMVLGAFQSAISTLNPDYIVGIRSCALITSAINIQNSMIIDPIRSPKKLTNDDPEWIHVPGAWKGANEQIYSNSTEISSVSKLTEKLGCTSRGNY